MSYERRAGTPAAAMAASGLATLVAGAATVNEPSVTAASRIFLACMVAGGTIGNLRVNTLTAGSGFTIASTTALDTSTVSWMVLG